VLLGKTWGTYGNIGKSTFRTYWEHQNQKVPKPTPPSKTLGSHKFAKLILHHFCNKKILGATQPWPFYSSYQHTSLNNASPYNQPCIQQTHIAFFLTKDSLLETMLNIFLIYFMCSLLDLTYTNMWAKNTITNYTILNSMIYKFMKHMNVTSVFVNSNGFMINSWCPYLIPAL
jgi:hypothetical protein